MGLDPRAVELPLDVRGLQSLETGRDVAGRLREHRADRAQRGQPEPRQPGGALAHRDLCHRGKIAREHRRAAHVRDRYAGRLRDRVRHHALERSLPKLAEKQADEQTLLGLGRSREELGELLAASGLGALADDGLQARHGRVDLEQLERRPVGRSGLLAQRRPPHADGSLRQLPRQIGDRDATSSGAAARRHSAMRSTFASRDDVAATSADVVAISARSIDCIQPAGKREPDVGPALGRIRRMCRASVRTSDRIGDRQPEPSPASAARGIRTAEALEGMGYEVGREPAPSSDTFEHDDAVRRARIHPDRSRTVPQRVVDEVLERLLEAPHERLEQRELLRRELHLRPPRHT